METRGFFSGGRRESRRAMVPPAPSLVSMSSYAMMRARSLRSLGSANFLLVKGAPFLDVLGICMTCSKVSSRSQNAFMLCQRHIPSAAEIHMISMSARLRSCVACDLECNCCKSWQLIMTGLWLQWVQTCFAQLLRFFIRCNNVISAARRMSPERAPREVPILRPTWHVSCYRGVPGASSREFGPSRTR